MICGMTRLVDPNMTKTRRNSPPGKGGVRPVLARLWTSGSSLRFKVQRLPTADLCYRRQWRNRAPRDTYAPIRIFRYIFHHRKSVAISFRTSAVTQTSIFSFWAFAIVAQRFRSRIRVTQLHRYGGEVHLTPFYDLESVRCQSADSAARNRR